MNLSNIQPPLRFIEGVNHIWEGLAEIPRTGWVQWEIPEPENVAEHILAIRSLAVKWRTEILLSETDFSDLLAIIEVHDWPEVTVGDLVIMGDEHNTIELRRNKWAHERQAMEHLCATLPQGKDVLALYTRYETGSDEVSRYAKELDKLQAVLLAEEYHKRYSRPGIVAEFVAYSAEYITIPFLLDVLEGVRKRMG